MKLYFQPSGSASGDGAAVRRRWDGFIAAAAAAAPPGTIVFRAAEADAVIHGLQEQYDTAALHRLARPLSSADLRRFVWDWGDRPTGRYSGFYCSLESRLFDARRHRTSCYPVAFNEMVDAGDQTDAVYDFGFVGGLSAGVRPRIFERLGPRQAQDNSFLRQQGADWGQTFGRGETDLKRGYADFLRQTRFVLCPRGYGVGSARMFETMKAGRVPVIISDDYVLPEGIDWTTCSLRIGEHQIDDIPALVASRLPDWPNMAAEARQAWEDHFSESRIVRRMADEIEAISADLPAADLGYQLRYGAGIAATFAALHARPTLGRLKRALTRG